MSIYEFLATPQLADVTFFGGGYIMGTLLFFIAYPLMAAIVFFLIAFGVKYGILWAVRALSEEQLAKIGRSFRR